MFVHANELTDRGLRVTAGTQVEFRVVEGERGLKAFDVRIVEDQRPWQGTAPEVAVAPVSRSNGHPVAAESRDQPPADEELFEVFSEREFSQQVTDLLLTAAPQLTGGVIMELRSQLLQFARKNGWVE